MSAEATSSPEIKKTPDQKTEVEKLETQKKIIEGKKDDFKIASETFKADKGKQFLRLHTDTENHEKDVESNDLERSLSDIDVFSDPKKYNIKPPLRPTEKKKENPIPLKTHEMINKGVSESVGKLSDAKIDSVKDLGSLEALDPAEKKEIHREIVRQSIKLTDLNEATQKSLREAASKIPDFSTFSKEKQEEIMLKDSDLQKKIEELNEAYSEAIGKKENLKDGKITEVALKKLLKDNLGIEGDISKEIKDAMSLDILKDASTRNKNLSGESAMDIVSRTLLEKGFKDIVSTVGAENLNWTHLSPSLRLQMMRSEKFQYDESILKKNTKFSADMADAIGGIQKREGESDADYAKRLQKSTGIDSKMINNFQKELGSGMDTSGLSSFGKFLMDIFSALGAALEQAGFMKGTMFQDYLNKNKSPQERDSSRYSSRNGSDEYSGEVGSQSPDLAQNGFKGDVMNSIWRWEYQAGRNVEVVNEGNSGLTLCGGIDLSWTSFSQAQNYFSGVLRTETIEKLKPFCQNGEEQGLTLGNAENLLKSKPGLKEEINSQLNIQNMGLAFSRSLGADWNRLVAKHGNVVKNAPGYIQTIMLSRFYHDGIGGSNQLIKGIINCNFDHDKTLSLLQGNKSRNGKEWYQNRIDKEIAYMKKKPEDKKPHNTVENEQMKMREQLDSVLGNGEKPAHILSREQAADKLSRGIAYGNDNLTGLPLYSDRAKKLGDYIAKIDPPSTGSNSCGAAVGTILNNFGYKYILPQTGRDGKNWDNILDKLTPKYFIKVPCSHPREARPGGILVYNGGAEVGGSNANRKYGHVEIKGTDNTYMSYVKSGQPGGSARNAKNMGFCGSVYYPV